MKRPPTQKPGEAWKEEPAKRAERKRRGEAQRRAMREREQLEPQLIKERLDQLTRDFWQREEARRRRRGRGRSAWMKAGTA